MATSKYVNISRFADNYLLEEILGKGSFSVVRRGVCKQTGNVFAIKIIPSKHLGERALQRINREIKICRRLSHPNICQFIDSYQEQNFYFLCFEIVSGGELFDDIVQRSHYSENDAAVCIAQLLVAITYYQDKNIIHRDIKPENLLLASKEPGAKIKLTDFGLALEVAGDSPQWHGFAGTSAYMSPEVIKRMPYGKPIDMWSCGVILYILLVGNPPFWSSNENRLYNQIKVGVYNTNTPHWQTLTDDGRDLVDRMLTVDPELRITPSEALNHPWIRNRFVRTDEADRSNALDGLRTFNARRRLRSAMVASMLVGQGNIRSSARLDDYNVEFFTTTYDLTPDVEVPAIVEAEIDDENAESNSFSFWQWLRAQCVVM